MQTVDDSFGDDIAGSIPIYLFSAGTGPQMEKDTVQKGMKIRPVDKHRVFLPDVQQMLRRIKQFFAIRRKTPDRQVSRIPQPSERPIEIPQCKIDLGPHLVQYSAGHFRFPLQLCLHPHIITSHQHSRRKLSLIIQHTAPLRNGSHFPQTFYCKFPLKKRKNSGSYRLPVQKDKKQSSSDKKLPCNFKNNPL